MHDDGRRSASSLTEVLATHPRPPVEVDANRPEGTSASVPLTLGRLRLAVSQEVPDMRKISRLALLTATALVLALAASGWVASADSGGPGPAATPGIHAQR